MSGPFEAALEEACRGLAGRDEAIARAYREIGRPDWREADCTYATLARMIAFQQISVKAGAAIWDRLEARLGSVTADALLDLEDDEIRACGFSRPKAGHLRAIAQAVQSGALDLHCPHKLPADAAREHLTTIRGIGPWTAELYLLYAGRQFDAFPTADLGLMESYRRLSGWNARPDKREFAQIAEGWRPWRGVAAHLLWGWINAERAK
mgnify:FL=1